MKPNERFSKGIFLGLIVFSLLLTSSGYGVIYISSIEDLQKIGNEVGYPMDGSYELTRDIDATDTVNWYDGAGFIPIGDDNNKFTGVLDGKGHKIFNLYINRPSEYNVGLFRFIGFPGVVENLGLENVQIIGYQCVGGVAGNNGGYVINCYSKGWIVGKTCVGGLVGRNTYNVVESYSASFIFGDECCGGVIGENFGYLQNSYSISSVSGGRGLGGLIGMMFGGGNVMRCYSAGSVVGDEFNWRACGGKKWWDSNG